MRIYITLNSEKPKDKIILDYLENSYDSKGEIKRLLYQIATNGVQIGISKNTTDEVVEVQNSDSEVQSEPIKNNIDDDILNFFK